ncbi:MAG: SPOR domain-containing protein [Cytophagaceae bacterium]|nr:SPOR domain-containing protein [Gemmatimonadaceae bacterium]
MSTSTNQPAVSLATLLGILVPLASAVAVAVIARNTNINVAELQRSAQASQAAVQQGQLRDQQETRRAEFLATNLPKMLGTDEVGRRTAKALLLLTYPNDAPGILQTLMAQAAPGDSATLARWTTQANTVQAATGDWLIVVSAHPTEADARQQSERNRAAGFAPVGIYLRNGVYRTTAGSYPSQDEAEQVAITVRSRLRPDAYPVAMGVWCPRREASDAVGGNVVRCGA